MAWDFSVGNVGATIADVLKSRDDSKTQQAIANAQIAASTAADNRSLALTADNTRLVQFFLVAVVVALVGYQIAKRA